MADLEPLDLLMYAIAGRFDIKAEYMADSPGWGQIFVSRPDDQHVVVVTNDGAEWCLTRWPNAAAFYTEDDAEAQRLEPNGTRALTIGHAARIATYAAQMLAGWYGVRPE